MKIIMVNLKVPVKSTIIGHSNIGSFMLGRRLAEWCPLIMFPEFTQPYQYRWDDRDADVVVMQENINALCAETNMEKESER